jgi:two-component system, NtrC family, sensor kinase
MGGLPSRSLSVLVALIGLSLFLLAVLNFQQQRAFDLPDDGVSWVDSSAGVKAWIVIRDGPGGRAGIRQGDTLLAINGRPARCSADAALEVFRSGAWARARYELLRQGERYETKVVITPQKSRAALRHYLQFLGLLYGLIGAFTLLRRRTTPRWLLLFAYCLASFGLYSLAYTGKLDALDWTVYWLNVGAMLFQPAIFLHLCLTFFESPEAPRRSIHSYPLVYVPGAFLLLLHIGVAFELLAVPLPLPALRWVLDRVELVYWAAFSLTGAVYLELASRRPHAALLRAQFKALARGAFLAVSPFAGFYVLPYLLGFVPSSWMADSAVFLVFLPLTFAYTLLLRRPSPKISPLTQAAACPS